MRLSTEAELTDFLSTYPHAVIYDEEGPGAVLDRYFAPDFEWHADGIALDRQRIIDHTRPARKKGTKAEVEVHTAMVSGDKVAAHYTLVATDKKTVTVEIFMVGHLAPDGRLARVDQLGKFS
jgi:hypothetical protein